MNIPPSLNRLALEALRACHDEHALQEIVALAFNQALPTITKSPGTLHGQRTDVLAYAGMKRLRELLKQLNNKYATNTHVATAWNEFVSTTGSADSNHKEACVIHSAQPFLNRTSLRHAVDGLLSKGTRVLLVHGADGFGKSITERYVRHTAPFYCADVFSHDIEHAPGRTPRTLGNEIAICFGWPLTTFPTLPPRSDSTEERDVACWVSGQAKNDMRSRIFTLVFDNVCYAGARRDTVDFVYHLAHYAALEDSLRVVLLSKTDIPLSVPNKTYTVSVEHISPITWKDLESFISDYCKLRGYSYSSCVIGEFISAIKNEYNRLASHNPLTNAKSKQWEELAREAMKLIDNCSTTDSTGHVTEEAPHNG